MNRKGMDRSELMVLLERYRKMDVSFESGRIFGSMCTSPHKLAREVHSIFQEANLGNPGLYPGSARMERDVICMLGSLLNLKEPHGHVLSGGTEANITAMYVAKKRTRKRLPQGKRF